MIMETTNGIYMDAEILSNYLYRLVNLFFKILPIRESGEASVGTYMKSLQAELLGCKELIQALHEDAMFLSLIAILQFLIDHQDSTPAVYKREVFKAISICNKLKSVYGSSLNGG